MPDLPTRTPEPVPTQQASDDKLRSDVETIAADALGFWQSMVGKQIPADIEMVTRTPECGDAVDPLALACFQDGQPTTLIWSRDGVARLQRDGTNVGVALLVAHEMGHIVLDAMGHGADGAQEERRSDCLAGAYLSVSKLDLGMTPSILWQKAFPATRGPSTTNASERARADSIGLGFEAQGDPLAFCLARA